jgi:hypothetical protein
MDYVSGLQDSIDTAIDMNLFANRPDAAVAHIFQSKLVKIPLTLFNDVDNFDVARLQKSAETAYPSSNRPRGDNDLYSVEYYQKQIQKQNEIPPIWMIQNNKKYLLLDGAHRIVASYIENVQYMDAYIIIRI